MTVSTEPSRAETLSKGRAPDFFIVGHAKSGTTALYEMLRRHPQVFMPELKETRYFARELHPDLLREDRASDEHPRTLEQYISLFSAARAQQRIGEATPSYLRSTDAARRIAELCPDARIVAILREPVEFLHSLHLQLLQVHVETAGDLRGAIALEPKRREEREAGLPVQQALLYTDHVHYVQQLRRYHAVFAPEQMLVLIYDDFRDDNEATVRRVLRFLEVQDTLPVAVREANPTVRVRAPRTADFVRSLHIGSGPATRTLKRGIKTFTPRALRREALALERRLQRGAPRPPDERLALELRRRFRGEVVALSEHLDRDLVALWGYDRID